MKINLILFITVCLSFFGCKDNDNESKHERNVVAISPSAQYFNDFNNSEKVKSLVQKIVKKGDTIAYKELRHIYYYSGHVSEFLPYSLIMANDYNYPSAYFNVYTEMNSKAEDKKSTSQLANYYLFVAYEMNAEHSKSTIEERFGENFIVPDSKKYWASLIN